MIQGLFDVYNMGTASSLRVEELTLLVKMTAENFVKLERKSIQLKDHSIFVALRLR
jgi:penicillin-binding protein 2